MKKPSTRSRQGARPVPQYSSAGTPWAQALFLQALEPRVLLDAAAARTVQEAAPAAAESLAPADQANREHADLVAALGAVEQHKSTPVEPPAARAEVYFIDRAVAQPEVLAKDLPAGAEVHFIEPGTDGLRFIAQTLEGRHDLDAIHIISHGGEGLLLLGSASLTLDSMQGDYRSDLAQIGATLSSSGDILLYGCDFARGATGAQAVELLGAITGADVAASTDDTGAAALGGDWLLETHSGPIETRALSAPDWNHVLTPPVLDTTPNLSYTGTEDDPAPVNGSVAGALISTFTSGITDVDPGAVKGIALTATVSSNGSWWYTLDAGTTWNAVGTVSTSSALLLADNPATRLYFQPNANFNGSAGNALTLRAWDQSAGTAGSKVNPTSIAGAVSTASDTVAVTVTAVNDAPLLLAGTRNMTSINEDLNSNQPVPVPSGAVGTTVPTFIGPVSDIDSGAVIGVAVVGMDVANGSWWYSINGGSNWAQISSVTDSNALLLVSNGNSRVYFRPNADYNGSATLTIRAWDQTSGSNGGTGNASLNGGTSAYSSATGTATLYVNAVPDIVADSASTPEDTAIVINPLANDTFENPGRTITAINGTAIIAGGAAISVNNGSVVLNADSTLTFTPTADFPGAAASGTSVFSYTVTSGGVTETANITVTVTQVQDAPRLDLDTSSAGTGYTAVYDQDPVPIVGLSSSLTDAENDSLYSMTVTLSGATAADSLYLTQTLANISSSYNAATGVLTLSGNTTLSEYKFALENVRFSTTSGVPGARTISVVAFAINAPFASNTATATFSLLDTDGDGVANAGDLDDNNDGILDIYQESAGPITTTPNHVTTSGSNPAGFTIATTIDGQSNVNVAYYRDPGPISLISYSFDTPVNNLQILQIYNNGGALLEDAQSISSIGEIRFLDASGNLLRSITSYSTPYSLPDGLSGAQPYQIRVGGSLNGVARIELHDVVGRGDAVVAFNELNVISGADIDTDGDGIPDRLDIDADNDGIPNTIEAQTTAGYKPPSGQGLAMIDVDHDGLDDRYDADTSSVNRMTAAASKGLTPVDSDGDGKPDYLDSDSDNDGKLDITERGDGQPTSVTSTQDSDGDGLLDIFEHGSVNDGYYVSDGTVTTSGSGLATTVTQFNLADSDQDTAANGSNAVPLIRDFDWRDNVSAPVIDLNSTVNAADGTRDYSTSQTGGGVAVNVAASVADISDFGDNDLSQLTIKLGGFTDGANEIINVAGINFAANANASQVANLGGANLLISYTVAGGFVITRSGGGVIADTVLDMLVRGVTYRNAVAAATPGTRTLNVTVTDTTGYASTAVSSIQVARGNLPPTPVNDTMVAVEDQQATGNVLSNDSDPDGDALSVASYTVAGDPTVRAAGTTTNITGVGALTLGADGAVVFTPVPDYYGAVPVVTYTLRDALGNTANATLTIGPVQAVQDPPHFTDPAIAGQTFNTGNYGVSINEDQAFNGQVTAVDPDNDALIYSVTTPPGRGSVTINSSTGAYVYTPMADYNGTDSFVVTVNDGKGGVVTSTVTMTVAPVADIAADTVTTLEDTLININVNANDSFENAGHVISKINGTAVTVGTPLAVTNGTVTLKADGTLDFMPTANFNGATSFSYTVTSGGVDETATVTVTVTAVNDLPVPQDPAVSGQTFNPATGNYAASTNEDVAFNGRVSATDVDGDTLSYSVTTQPTRGSVTINAATGAYVYTPTADYNGVDSFVVTINDGKGGVVTSTVSMTVAPVVDIAADSVTTLEDTLVNINVNANDSFENAGHAISKINGTAVTVGTPLAVTNGTVTLKADGSLDFMPTANFNGVASFTYTVTSGGVDETATVAVTVTAVNDPPVPQDPAVSGQTFNPATGNYAASTNEDVAFNGRVSATDVDGDTLNYTVSTLPTRGTVTINSGTGAYVYTPTADYNGTDSFVVTINDGKGGVVTSTVTMTVAPVADIAADTVTTAEDTLININVNANDSFENAGHVISKINGTAVTVGTPLAVTNGSVTLKADGTLDFMPTANFNGSTNFTYSVASGGVEETATVTVNVTAVNDLPVPQDPGVVNQTFNPATGNYAASTNEDVAFNGRVSATDVDGDTLNYTVSTLPAHGTATINSATGAYVYTPTADYNGADSFIVTINDSKGGVVTSTVTMTVAPVSDIAADSVTTLEDTLVNINVNANDSFENAGHAISKINGTAVIVGTPLAVTSGTVTLKADGTLDFMPTANFNGSTNFTYSVASGGVEESATVTVNVTAVNDLPVPQDPVVAGQTFNPATGNYAATTNEDVPFNGRVSATDVDGDTLSYSVTTQPGRGSVTINGATGAYVYTPTADYNGADSFIVTINDGKGGVVTSTVTMAVAAVADITADTVTTNEDTLVNINVNANDSFENVGHVISKINGTAVAVGTPLAVTNGTVTLKANGTLDFMPTANFNGATNFTYSVASGGVEETATVTVNVTAVNDLPVPQDPAVSGQTFNPATGNYAATTNEDVAFTGRVSATDVDGDTLSYSVTTQPTRGSVTINAATGAYVYTPTADYNGADSFVVTLNDGKGGLVTSTVSMTIVPVADIAADTIAATEDTLVNINVNANDSFEDPGHTIVKINGVAVSSATPVLVANGSVTLKADGTLDFMPAVNFNGATHFSYTVLSGGQEETATVTVNVAAVNDAPSAQDPSVPGQTFDPATGNYAASTSEDQPFNGQVTALDVDGDALTYSVSAQPVHGVVSINAATGDYLYTPNADYNGADSFVVSIDDGHGAVVQSSVSLVIAPVTDIANDSVTTPEDTPVNIDVLANDSFEDAGRVITKINGMSVSVGSVIALAHGTVTLKADGTLDFLPSAHFNGATSFTYSVASGGVEESATVTVNVTAVNDLPQPQDPGVANQVFNPITGNYTALTDEDTAFNGRVLASDLDNDTLAYSVHTPPSHGSVTIDAATGAYVYTPTADYNGADSFVVSIDDGHGGVVQSSVNITINAVVDIADDSVTTLEDTPVNIDVNANDSFDNPGHVISKINGTAVTVGTPLAVNNGTVTLKADGTLDFIPAANFSGTTGFSYSVTSGGVDETATLHINVTPVNDSPQPQDPGLPPQTFNPLTGNYAVSINEDTTFNGRVSATDLDNDPLSYTLATSASHGSVSINSATGAYSYTPIADYNGSDSFVVSIDDGHGGVVQSTVVISIAPVADISADIITTNEDTPVNIDVNANDSFENPGHVISRINGTPVSVGVPLAVANGSVTLKGDGSLDFMPATRFNGATGFSYTVTSGGIDETASVTVNVTSVPYAPVPHDPGGIAGQSFNPATGNYSVNAIEDIAFQGQVAASDPDNDTLTYSVVAQPGHGRVSIDPASGVYLYTPAADYNGSDSFLVEISDGTGGTALSSVILTISPVADIAADTFTCNEDTPVTINVNANDSFEDAGHAISRINGVPVEVGSPLAVANGTVTLKADGNLDFMPSANFNGVTRLTYTVTSGGVDETATVTVNVTPVNDPPQWQDPGVDGQGFNPATGNYSFSTPEDVVFNGRVLASDVDNDSLIYSVGTAPMHGTLSLDGATGAYTYTPVADYNGADSFVVSIDDGHGAVLQSSVSISIAAVADIAADTITTLEDTPVNIDVNANDSFDNAGHVISKINGMPVSVGTPLAVANGRVTLKADGTLDFVPSANFNGSTLFLYTVSSGGVEETSNVSVNITPVNDPPQLQDPGVAEQAFNLATGNYAASTREDVAFNGRVSATDVDGDTLNYSVSTQPTQGRVTINASTGAYVYTPTADYNGADSFVVTINDGKGGLVTSTVSMAIAPVADIAADTVTTAEDTRVTIDVNANDSFANSGHVISRINGSPVSVGTPLAVNNGTVTLKADGTLDFNPTANFNGATRFTYTVTSAGIDESATVTVNVTPVNDLPHLQDPGRAGQIFDPATGNYSVSLDEDSVFNGQVLASDVDGDTLSYSLGTLPVHGNLILNAGTGAYLYRPNADYHGADSFVVSISDGHGGVVQSRVDISIAPVADIAADSVTTNAGTPVTVDVNANDRFANSGHLITRINGSPVSVDTPLSVANGTVTLKADGTLYFIPDANFRGSSVFTYTVASGGTEETASVTVKVLARAVLPNQEFAEVRAPSTPRPAEGLRPVVDTVVVEAVNALGSLSGTAQLLEANGVVRQAVSGLDDLNGLGELTVHGVVGQTVNDLHSLQGIEASGDAGDGLHALLDQTPGHKREALSHAHSALEQPLSQGPELDQSPAPFTAHVRPLPGVIEPGTVFSVQLSQAVGRRDRGCSQVLDLLS